MEYDFKKIEKKWQKKWESEKVFVVSEKSKKPKFYVLEMFPYPSGEGLHMGHALNYTIGDVFARFKRMSGFNVLYPMGYDALGLPAENAAIKAGVPPAEYTSKAIKNYIKQQKAIGLSYDWSRIVNTADPKYYKWDQWIFLKMFEKGLAYRKKSSVNWCGKCNTVLANEQVVNGCCWRHEDTEVEMKSLEQWFLKITDYADELLKGHESLDWPQRTILMQKNWIGKSFGTEINFEIGDETWKVFTTRPDTIFGVTFMVVSAQHPKLMELVTNEQKKEVKGFLKKIKKMDENELEKEGVFTGSYAINPINGEKVPVWVGNFVVADYGSGMVMAVPAHDQRDFDFAKKYKIEIKQVIAPTDRKKALQVCGNLAKDRGAYTGPGELVHSETGEVSFTGCLSEEAKEEITRYLIKKKLGKKTVNYKLKDWGISRQRYWGTPIPIIHCEKCGAVPVPEKDLPVELPKKVKFGKGNPLATNENWIKVKCPKCGKMARRETDTMDTFVNSSWYYLRYCDANNDKAIFDKKKAKYWMPVDQYIGGAEHACMHLIYFRFYLKFLRDLGLVDFDEPAKKLFHQGMLHGEGGEKMSKSKGNVINPDEVSEKYGIDTARLFLLSLASPDKNRDWSEKGIQGSLKFMKKVVENFGTQGCTPNNIQKNIVTKGIKIGKSDAKIQSKLNKVIKDVTKQIEDFQYNLAIIRIRDLFNSFGEEESKEVLEKSLKLLHVFCPHITEELWEKIGGKGFISLAEWPKVDEKKIDEKFEKQEEAVEKLIMDVNNVKQILQIDKPECTVVFPIPKEIGLFEASSAIIQDNTASGAVVVKSSQEIINNSEIGQEYKDKAKKAKPGKPGVYVSGTTIDWL